MMLDGKSGPSKKVPIDCIGKCVAVIYDGLSTKHLIE